VKILKSECTLTCDLNALIFGITQPWDEEINIFVEKKFLFSHIHEAA